MNSRERVQRVLAGGLPDRVPLDDGFWTTTTERWWREGLPPGVQPHDYFGFDMVYVGGDYSLQLPERLVEQTETTRTYWDSDGALRKDSHTAHGWTSQWLDYSIKTREDWARYKQRLTFHASRIHPSTLEAYQRARAQGKAVLYSGHACFHPTWSRLGMVHEMLLMIEDPDFIHDLFAAHAQLIVDIYDDLRRRGLEFDGARLADDLGYVAAPLISPAMYAELVLPHHHHICEHLAADGVKTLLHSDGNVAPLIPGFLKAGFVGLHPLEAKAGLDVRELKPRYGQRLILFGNIDVRKLSGTKADVEEEICAKLPVAKAGGGYIYHSDHSVPHSVSFENYCFAMDLLRKHGSYE
jgi:uroporphyrinogen decarboxylase